MKKKALTLILAFSMVFSAAVPTFADAELCKNGRAIEEKHSPVLLMLGDSASSGYCNEQGNLLGKNSSYLYNKIIRPYGRQREIQGKNGKVYDTTKLDIIKLAFPGVLKELLGEIDEINSYNFCYPGFRAKEYCYLFDWMSEDEKYEIEHEDAFSMKHMDGKTYVSRKIMKKAAAEAAKSMNKADIICVQLGLNDMNAMLENDLPGILDAATTLVQKHFGIDIDKATTVDIKKNATLSNEEKATLEKIKQSIDQLKSPEAISDTFQALTTIICGINSIEIDVSKLLVQISNALKSHTKESQKYINRLTRNIRCANPQATIVLVNLYDIAANIITDPSISGEWSLNKETIELLDKLVSDIPNPAVNQINKGIYKAAIKYNCAVADISSVKPGYISQATAHPTIEGQRKIAETIYKAIKRDYRKKHKCL